MALSARAHAPHTQEQSLLVARRKAFANAKRHSMMVHFLRRAIPLGTVFVITGYIVASLFGGRTTGPTVDVSNIESAGTEIALENPRVRGTTDKGQNYEITALNAFQNVTNPQDIRFEGVDAKIDNQDGKPTLIKANSARFDGESEIVKLKGDVKVTGASGETIEADTMTINMASSEILAQGGIKMQTENGIMSARQVDVSEDGSKILFEGPVKVLMHYRSKEQETFLRQTQ